jgi:RNA polymerase sigma factor (sigma-70 family)
MVKKMTESQQLLAQYVETGSEAAFRDLVMRYVDLVYSAAVRLVDGDTHLAQDVTQTVFADLARMARSLSREVMIGGWLHRHACFVAGKTLRSERRRRARERQAVEMNAIEDHSAANLALIAPILDEAIDQLGPEDRAAIVLRFFEQGDFRAVGEALGSNEDAARKRVERALDKLHGLLTRRGVVLSATALGATLATQAVTAAPAGFAVSVSTAALAAATSGGGTALTLLKIMSMTKLKIGIVGAVITAAVAVPWVMQHQAQTRLAEASESLRQRTEQNSRLAAENERLSNLLPRSATPAPPTNDSAREVLRLRGEVGRLRRESAEEQAAKTNSPSPLSGLTSDPGMWKLIRDQQKASLTAIYKEFASRMTLPPEQADKLVNLLADDVMENIDHVTAVLREGKTPEQMNQVFAAQEAALLEKVKGLLGPEGESQYQDYTRNLASHLTVEQFKGKLTGDAQEQEAKARQLYQVMQEETQRALANAGLPADYQTVPSLNFRNIASEVEGENSLSLLDGIYAGVMARAGSFLSPEEFGALGQFRTNAMNSTRMTLSINRKMMAPGTR